MSLTITLRRNQGFAAAREVVLNYSGKRQVDEPRREIAFVMSAERRDMIEAERDYGTMQARTRAGSW